MQIGSCTIYLSMQKLQYSYVHRKQDSKWIWKVGSADSHVCDFRYLLRTQTLSSLRAHWKYDIFDHLRDKTMLCFHRNLRAENDLLIDDVWSWIKRYNNAPVLYTFRKLIILLSPFLLLLLLWWDIRCIQESKLTSRTFWCESFNDGTTGFVDKMVFCAFANFWWRSDNCNTA